MHGEDAAALMGWWASNHAFSGAPIRSATCTMCTKFTVASGGVCGIDEGARPESPRHLLGPPDGHRPAVYYAPRSITPHNSSTRKGAVLKIRMIFPLFKRSSRAISVKSSPCAYFSMIRKCFGGIQRETFLIGFRLWILRAKLKD